MNTTVEFATRSVPFRVKSLDEAKGEFSGYLATWDLDLQLDRIQRGAFAKSLLEAKAKQLFAGNPFMYTLLWMHDPHEPIGGLYSAEEDSTGLFVRGLVDLDTELGRRAFSAMRKGYMKSLSIGYKVHKAKMLRDGVCLLEELELVEGSLVSFPANPEARIADVKGLDGKGVWLDSLVKDIRRTAARYGANKRKNYMNDFEDAAFGGDRVAKPLHIEFGRPEESRTEFERSLRKQQREEDDLWVLTPGSKAFTREVEKRQAERAKKQRLQREALEAERKEQAERQAAMSAETFTPESFAAASGLGAEWSKRWFYTLVKGGRAVPVDESGLVLRAQDVRAAAKRDAELIELEAIRARNKRLEGAR